VLAGQQRHGNSMGTSAVLGPNDAQWMTAGRGIIHQELAEGAEQVHSLQLWVNSELTLAADGSARVLVFSGLPIGEPVVQQGPFVMNTQAEIAEAVSDYRAGRLAPTPTR
jgi:redox-sensitive bicupin YhaK (pirin superfamily)